ncbi:DHH family phosphoesterase [Miniphocaeibacter massiliensis]|uniref:DHH family phosphoesterase n=1 Tax=Miniphocaeibacter massiliensis TaxID=2041841 RepID=UPI00101ADDCC|nr:DHH family phosphoesterase [Miniphocaeibacter massiliensis]
MKKSKFFKWSDVIIFFIALILLSIVIVYYNAVLGVIAFIITVYLVFYESKLMQYKSNEFERYIENIDKQFDEITRRAIFSMPFPLVILNGDCKIKWYNTKFKEVVGTEETYINIEIENIFSEIKKDSIYSGVRYIEVKFNEKFYKFYINIFEKDSDNSDILLYAVDYTGEYKLNKELIDTSLVAVNINIDNYDEIYENTEDNVRPMVFAEVDRVINNFVQQYKGYSVKFEQEDYFVIISHENLEQIMENKFNILDQVRELEEGNKIPITLSIGVGTNQENILETFKVAKACTNIALGRGGDQTVVKIGDHYEYYGGKRQSTYKSSAVKARVIANGLVKILEQGGNIFIMGHKNPDMDSIGSCLGIMEAANIVGKNSYIVLDRVTPAIENIYNSVLKNYPDENIEEKFISPNKAIGLCEAESVVVVLDHHRRSHSECEELLDLSKNIVLIDHHRRGSEYIENAILTYLEPHASSTSELVTEVIFYMSEKVKIPKVIAEALLAGITVDTKNFILQTGVRTFEAASILKRQGADSVEVKQLFRDDEKTVKLKGDVVANSEIYKNRIAIGVLNEKIEESILIAAQAADEMLNMNGIEASFVLTLNGDKIHISGRSLGQISVQLILEKLGGGGHLTSAGTQLEESMDGAINQLKNAITDYLEEDENESNSNR